MNVCFVVCVVTKRELFLHLVLPVARRVTRMNNGNWAVVDDSFDTVHSIQCPAISGGFAAVRMRQREMLGYCLGKETKYYGIVVDFTDDDAKEGRII